MRIFTLGKKGVPLLFFALFLFSGTTMYGQEGCPTPGGTDSEQSFCYLQTIGDIVTDGSAVYQTADNVNDTQPIPEDELLTDGVTYYIGGTSGDCERIAVTVTVNVVERPTNTIFPNSPSFEITPCSSTNFTADDLASYFNATRTGYQVEVYTTQFGTNEAEGELTPGESYFVAQVPSTGTAGCPSLRAAVGYNPITPVPPVATSPQVFCEGATVADLQAEGTYDNTQAIRWYRTAAANSPLANDIQLINGQTYYATQIVNDRNSPFPPCESNVTPVIVEVQNLDAGEQVGDGIYCQSEIDSRLESTPADQLVRELFTEQLGSTVPTDGTFENLGIDEVISQYQSGIRSFSTTYTITTEGGCEDSVALSFTIEEDFNAGEDNITTTVCRAELPDSLTETDTRNLLLSLLSEDADTDGTFSAQTVAEITTAFNSGDGTGTYSTTYSGGTDQCADSAEIAVTVLESGNAGDDADLVFCKSEIVDLVTEYLSTDPTPDPDIFFAEWIGDRDTNGNFTGDPLTSLITQYQTGGPIEVSTTYIIGEGTECEDSAEISLTIIEGGEVTDNSTTICISDIPMLFEETPEDVRAFYVALAGGTEGGSFEPSIEELIAQYVENNIGDFRTIYTVGLGTACEDSAELTVTINDLEEANAGSETALTFCSTEGEFDLTEYLNEDANQSGYFEELENNMFNPSEAGVGTFSFTYTVDASTGCVEGEDSATYTLEVIQGANAGSDKQRILCSDQVDNLFNTGASVRRFYLNLLDENVSRTGYFDPPLSELTTRYVNEEQTGDFTTFYFLGEGECVDSAELTVTINDVEEANAGSETTLTFCSSKGELDLTEYLNEDANQSGYFEELNNNMFNPSEAGVGTFTFTYTVDESINCVTGQDSATYTVEVIEGDANAGGDVALQYCITEVEDMTEAEVLELFNSLLGEDVNEGGEFSPSLEILIAQFVENPIGTFSTTYTVGEGQCSGSAELSITVNDVEEANAGSDTTLTFCSTEGELDLTEYLNEDANQSGYFEELENNMFNPSEAGVGTFSFTYTVDASTGCVEGEDSATYTLEVIQGANAGSDKQRILCSDQVDNLFNTGASVRRFYLNLLDENVSRTGYFDPPLSELTTRYVNEEQTGDFTTFYFLGEGECVDSAELTVTINDVEEANAGSETTLTFCSSEGELNLTEYLNADANQSGNFEELENNMFNPSEAGVGTFTFTYTVDESINCVTGQDSAVYTIEVIEGDANAGGDNSTEVCQSDIDEMLPNVIAVRNFYLDLLDEGISRDGTFNPTIQQLADRYTGGDRSGDFTTIYTLGSGNCTSSVELTVTVLENPDAGQSVTVNLEEDATETADLFDELGGTPEANGTWTFDGEEVDGTFDPATDEEGVYTYTVTSENGCSASATVTVVIGTQEQNCPEVTVTEQTFCDSEPTVADLMPAGVLWYSSTDATEALDVTTVLVDGSVYYAGPVEGICDDRPSVTVTLSDSPAVPTVTPFTQCDVDGATIADLDITGEADATFTVYSDETLATEVGSTEELTEGTYYVTQTNVAGCVSDAASLPVSFSNSDAPVLVSNAECIPIDGTLADLEEIVSANGDITWYATATSTDPLSRMTTITDGTIYYATSTNDEGCESSTRLAVTADFCPIVIPEIFTPNGDGINDYFAITGISAEYPNHMLEIYNRWGEPVYVGKGENPGWDGTSTEGSIGSGVLPVGVYFYILYYNDGQTAPTQGKLYLSR